MLRRWCPSYRAAEWSLFHRRDMSCSCLCRCSLSLSPLPKKAVISTEATDSPTACCAVERPPHFAFAVACSCRVPAVVCSCLAFVFGWERGLQPTKKSHVEGVPALPKAGVKPEGRNDQNCLPRCLPRLSTLKPRHPTDNKAAKHADSAPSNSYHRDSESKAA